MFEDVDRRKIEKRMSVCWMAMSDITDV